MKKIFFLLLVVSNSQAGFYLSKTKMPQSCANLVQKQVASTIQSIHLKLRHNKFPQKFIDKVLAGQQDLAFMYNITLTQLKQEPEFSLKNRKYKCHHVGPRVDRNTLGDILDDSLNFYKGFDGETYMEAVVEGTAREVNFNSTINDFVCVYNLKTRVDTYNCDLLDFEYDLKTTHPFHTFPI